MNLNSNVSKIVRVRFAPSPTGHLHIGGARTALFNWLFARNQGGKFILRIEDTDVERSEKKFEKEIFDGLRWLGINWDEGPDIGGEYGPYRQSERLNIYENYLKKLLNENKAYYCFCSKKELEANRRAMMSQGLAPKYSGKCGNFPKKESESRLKKGDSGVIRLRMPSKEVEFHDIIRGKIKFNVELIGDIIIAKNFKEPLYNFSAAIDDYEMKISHVIRGEEHLANTPKQIIIQEALGLEYVKYAHLPLILTSERRKMSKRYLDVSLEDYRQSGYLTETIVNFIAMLGWHPADNREILGLDELIKEFDIKRVQKAGAVFNIDKLDWLNAQYIKNLSPSELAEKIKNFIPAAWYKNKNLLEKIIGIEKERIKKMSDFKDLADFFFELPDYDARLLAWRDATPEKTANNLKITLAEIEKINDDNFNKETIEQIIMPLAQIHGIGDLFWPLRAALSGKQSSPGPFEILEILGKEESLRRIKIALSKF